MYVYRYEKLCVASAMHAAGACITSNFAVEQRVRGTVSSLVSESSCRKTRMSSHIVAGVYLSYTYTGGSSSRHTPPSRWRETVSCLVYLSHLIQRTENWRRLKITLMYNGSPGKVCFFLERCADGRTKNHASFSPGNAASSMTNANLSPALWSSASVAINTTQEQVVKARRTYTDGEKKPNRRIMSWFPGEMLHHQGQSKSASCFDEHCASRNSSKAIRSFSGPRVLLMRLWIADV